MKTILLTGTLIAIFHFGLHAQVGINETGAPPHENAGLDVDFTNKGFLPPRLTSQQRDEMTGSIPPGLFIFNTTTNCFEFHLGSIWQTLGCGCVTAPDAPAAFVSSGAGYDEISIAWSASAGASSYVLDVSEQMDFSGFTGGYQDFEVGSALNYTIIGLNPATTYYYRLRSVNACGTSSSSAVQSFTTAYVIGMTGPAGGVIFHDKGFFSDGFRYLEAAASDESTGTEWGCQFQTISGADGTAVGSGEQNSSDIDAECTASGIAAEVCLEYSSGGESDWYLPAKDELVILYQKREEIGGFDPNGLYWSSSEYDGSDAWYVQYYDGMLWYNGKGMSASVRCIRSF